MIPAQMPEQAAWLLHQAGRRDAHHEEGLHGPDNHFASRHALALASADASDHLVAHNGVCAHLQQTVTFLTISTSSKDRYLARD